MNPTDDHWRRRTAGRGPAVPILVKRMNGGAGRIFWFPVQYKAILTAVYDGKPFTLRSLALKLGYEDGVTKKGKPLVHGFATIRDALVSMSLKGIGILTKARGRHGWHRFRVQTDVVAAKVRTPVEGKYHVGRRETIEPFDVVRTFEERGAMLRARLTAESA